MEVAVDEITLLAAAASALLAAGVTRLFVKPESPVLTGETKHVHEASHANPKGWFCDCGKHQHNYVFAIEGKEQRRCQCGKAGTGKEWAR